MNTTHFERTAHLPVPVDEAFAWHERPGAFDRLTPAWEPVTAVDRRGTIHDGDGMTLKVHIGPLPIRWKVRHKDFKADQQFRDVQESGPFAQWEHTHAFERVGGATLLRDAIDYALPFEPLSRAIGGASVERRLDRLFHYRHRLTREDLAMHHTFSNKPRQTVAVTGATGMVGSALCSLLTTGGHRVVRVTRGRPDSSSDTDQSRTVQWDPMQSSDASALEGVDCVIHLAGENVGSGRWTTSKKKAVMESRREATRRLVDALLHLDQPPRTLISASAIGYYGSRGDAWLDESSSSGEGFLAEVCRAWEQAVAPAADAGIRTVTARLAVVLSPLGGALGKMLTPFRMGAGGTLGPGTQYMSWISLDDAIGALHHCMMTDALAGPVNIGSPEPVTNAAFTAALGEVLHRPTIAPMPAAAVRLVFGQMGEEMLLASQRVSPVVLASHGYRFRHADLEDALRHMLGRPVALETAS